MFRLFKKDDENANRLKDEAEPNKISWTSGDGEPDDAEEFDEDAEAEADQKGEADQEGEADEADQEGEADEADQEGEEGGKNKLDLEAELAREAEEYGLTSSNPTQLYGPNGEDVASVIDALADIDDDTANDIADAYDAVPDAERKVARSEVRRLQRSSDYESELWAAEHAVSDWLAALDLDEDGQALYSIVADAASDAVDALILEDELVDLDFNTLYGPWSDVMDADEEESDEAGAAEDSDAAGKAEAEEDEAEEDEAGEDEPEEDEGEFGPNTELVEEFFRNLAEITPSEISALVEAWRTQPKEELRVAHRDLQDLADEEPNWRKQLHLAQDEVFSWINGQSERIKSRQLPLGNLREVSGPVIADAVAALVMADMLEAEDAEVLYAPWASVIKSPALPQYEEDDEESEEEPEPEGKGRGKGKGR